MPRRGTTESVALNRAEKKQKAHQIKYGMLQTQVEPKYKVCDFCGRNIMVNNYADGKSRTPRWRNTGLVICPWCDPTTYTGTVTKPILYKTIMSRVLVEKLANMDFCFKEVEQSKPKTDRADCKCLACAARRITAIQEKRLEV
jgi:hypothetical protein